MNDSLNYTAAPPPTVSATGGVFIAFEGGDGAGKSTQIKLLNTALSDRGHAVTVTREPGGTDIGERLRALVLETGNGEIDARTEALIFAAARAAHAEQKIRPALQSGAIVLCDRYIDSSVAYQGAGRGLGLTSITSLNLWATQNLLPDLTVLLDVPVESGRHRTDSRGGTDRLEAESDSFHTKIHRAFGRVAAQQAHRYARIDGTGTIEEVHGAVLQAVEKILKERT